MFSTNDAAAAEFRIKLSSEMNLEYAVASERATGYVYIYIYIRIGFENINFIPRPGTFVVQTSSRVSCICLCEYILTKKGGVK